MMSQHSHLPQCRRPAEWVDQRRVIQRSTKYAPGGGQSRDHRDLAPAHAIVATLVAAVAATMRLSWRSPLKSLETLLPGPVQLAPSPPPTPKLASTLVSRRVRYRGVYLLLLIISLSAYFCLIHPTFSSRLAVRGSRPLPPDPLAAALDSIRAQMVHGQRRPHLGGSPLVLDAPQEPAAVSSFLASLRSNSIPHFVDPSRPIDPELVLEFDTRSPRAQEEVRVMVKDVWAQNPVFLYSKVRSCPR